MKDHVVKPAEYDVIFAFASLLHLSREELGQVLPRYCMGLKEGGVMCMSYKSSPVYEKRLQRDQFGERVFYYYHPDEIMALLPEAMREIDRRLFQKGSTQWFTLMMRKEGGVCQIKIIWDLRSRRGINSGHHVILGH